MVYALGTAIRGSLLQRIAGVCESRIPKLFLFYALLRVTGFCTPGGVRVVSEKPDLSAGFGVSPAKPRVTDGARTRDLRDHNPMLCQLSYDHQAMVQFYQPAPGVQKLGTMRGRSKEPLPRAPVLAPQRVLLRGTVARSGSSSTPERVGQSLADPHVRFFSSCPKRLIAVAAMSQL